MGSEQPQRRQRPRVSRFDAMDFISAVSNAGGHIVDEIDAVATAFKQKDARKDRCLINFSMSRASKLPGLGSAPALIEKMEEAGYEFRRNEALKTRPYELSLADLRAMYRAAGVLSFGEKNNIAAVRVAVANLKGGVGKTTATANIAAGLMAVPELIQHQLRICVIDLDPQGSQSYNLGVNPVRNQSAFAAIAREASADTLKKWIQPTLLDGLHVLPANTSDAYIIRQFQTIARTKNVPLSELLERYVIRHLENDYDLILMDTAPHLDDMMMNVLASGEGLCVTTIPELVAVDSTAKFLEGFSSLFESIPDFRFNPKLFRVLFNQYDKRDVSTHGEVADLMVKTLPGSVFNYKIPMAQPFKTSQVTRETIYEIPPKLYNGDPDSLRSAVNAMTDVVIEFFDTYLAGELD